MPKWSKRAVKRVVKGREAGREAVSCFCEAGRGGRAKGIPVVGAGMDWQLGLGGVGGVPQDPDNFVAQFRKFMPKWPKQLQMLPHGMRREQASKSKQELCEDTWCVLGRSPEGKRGIGCVVCAEGQRMLLHGSSVQCKLANTVRAYAQYDVGCAKLANLRRHQSSPGHIACAAAYLGIDYNPGVDAKGARKFGPSKEEFRQVWDAVSAGVSAHAGVKGLCAKSKMREMAWCIAEAMRSKDREFVSSQVAGALMRDDGHGRMHVRYWSTNKALETRSFMLGQMRTCASGTAADAKTKNTAELFRRFATPGTPPGTPARPPGEVMPAVYEKIRTSLHQVTYDSASNEKLSGEMMRRGLALDQAMVFAPNVRMVTRDKTHGSRRIITRTLKADPVLKSIMEAWVTGSDTARSVASVIDSSDEIKDKFRRFAEKDMAHIGSQVWNLGWAPHRYESVAKPLGRMIHCIYAVIQTAEWVAAHRGDSQGQAGVMIDWLKRLSAEEYLIAAMVCDATHENLDLIRFTEPEDIDVAEMHGAVATFRHRIRFLFGREEGCRKVPCYTKFALGAIARVCSFRINNDVRSFGLQGGVPEELWKRCIARLHPWLVMAEKLLMLNFRALTLSAASQSSHAFPRTRRRLKSLIVRRRKPCSDWPSSSRCAHSSSASSSGAWSPTQSLSGACPGALLEKHGRRQSAGWLVEKRQRTSRARWCQR